LEGRIAYRFLQLYSNGLPDSSSPNEIAASPLTLAIFATLVGYYVTYAIGLLRWAQRAKISERKIETPTRIIED
jgi:hypothetical protein